MKINAVQDSLQNKLYNNNKKIKYIINVMLCGANMTYHYLILYYSIIQNKMTKYISYVL